MQDDFARLASPFVDETIGAVDTEPPGLGARLDRLVDATPFGRFDAAQGGAESEAALDDERRADDEGEAFGASGERRADDADEAPEWEDRECVGEFEAIDFEDPAPESEAWSGSAEQIAFRDRVLAEHIARSRKARGDPQPDLPDTALDTIAGTDVKTARATAAAAGRLLAAANADLAEAQRAGHPDALKTVRLSATSGYRSQRFQRDLWLRYFGAKGGYYDRTQAARERLAQGPHSDEAVAYMLRRKKDGGFGIGGRIAAPGYSNHQNGIAVDFRQQRTKGHRIENKSDDRSRARWRDSWFHEWLKAHAATHGFQPIPTEEWHWEFRGAARQPAGASTATAAPAARGAGGGRLFAFESRVVPTRVAVFCPTAAASAPAVTVLLYAHGLLAPCGMPARIPEGIVTDAPFRLDRIVAASNRPVVLVVPHLDWAHPGGAAAFGRGHERWHAFAQPANLNRLVAEALDELGRARAGAAPALAELVVAGHSRAYDFLEPLAQSRGDASMRQGALARLTQVWAFDTTYAGRPDDWRAWLDADPTLRVTICYRPGSKTAAVGDAFHRRRGGRLQVLRVSEQHCDVPARRLPDLLAALGPASAGEIDAEGLGHDEADTAEPYADEPTTAEPIDEHDVDAGDTDTERDDDATDEAEAPTLGLSDLEPVRLFEHDPPPGADDAAAAEIVGADEL